MLHADSITCTYVTFRDQYTNIQTCEFLKDPILLELLGLIIGFSMVAMETKAINLSTFNQLMT